MNISRWQKFLALTSLIVVIILNFKTQPAHVQTPDWELQNPSPTGNSLMSVWSSSGSNVFAVGNNGTILHYDGSSWSTMSSGTTVRLNKVWGNSENNVYAVGDNGTILHYNGSSWSAMSSGTTDQLWGIWGSSDSDIFAVGGFTDPYDLSTGGTILHYNGSYWSRSSTIYYLYDVWGSSGSDVFAVGLAGTILHYNGNSWSTMNSGISLYGSIEGVWGSSGNDVFAVGGEDFGNAFIVHYDGNNWSAMNIGTIGGYLSGVWGSSGSDVFAVGPSGTILHYNGNSWSTMNSGISTFISGVWGSSDGRVFAVGDYGNILYYMDTSADLGFSPNPNGYKFPNYGASDLVLDDFIRMLGQDAVCWFGSDCVPKPTAYKWYSAINKSMAFGHCDGMASTSLRFFMGFDDESDFQGGANDTYDLDLSNVHQHIAYYFAKQSFDPVADYKEQIRKKSPSEILVSQFQKPYQSTNRIKILIQGRKLCLFLYNQIEVSCFLKWESACFWSAPY